jgi:hypothetical protein
MTKTSYSQAWETFILLTIFGIAMGFLEGIVVVYLRQVYYPKGFDFPLTLLSPEMMRVEWLRETATIVMLGAIGWLAGKNFIRRLSFFLFTFAVWDITYYAALKMILDWPASWLTWDILFLIPVPWLGPVLAPVICSMTMILMALLYILLPERGKPLTITLTDWILVLGGSAFILYTFIRDYLYLIISTGILKGGGNPETSRQFWNATTSYIPDRYSWYLFVIGELLILASLYNVTRRSLGNKPRP